MRLHLNLRETHGMGGLRDDGHCLGGWADYILHFVYRSLFVKRDILTRRKVEASAVSGAT